MGQVRRAVGGAVGAVVLVLAWPAAVAAGGDEWHRSRIGAPQPANGVVVAVVDTGVDAAHPAFTGRVLPAIDLVADGHSGDPVGHGTHVAGTIAAADGPCGGVSVTPDAQILPVRVLDADGSGDADTVVAGIRAAADAGARVINLSLGPEITLLGSSGSGLEEGIRYAWSRGAVPVLAAGNNDVFGALFGSRVGDLPAVVVTATDHEDRIASYATPVGSAMWGIAAPGGAGTGVRGEDVYSTLPGGTCGLSAGTSMAAPHVSGALAALLGAGLGPDDAIARLLDTAAPVGSRTTYGAGRVDVAAAMPQSSIAPPPAPAAAPEVVEAPASSGADDPRPVVAPAGPQVAGPPGASTSTTLEAAPLPSRPTAPRPDARPAESAAAARSAAAEPAAPSKGPAGFAAASAVAAVGYGAIRVRRQLAPASD